MPQTDTPTFPATSDALKMSELYQLMNIADRLRNTLPPEVQAELAPLGSIVSNAMTVAAKLATHEVDTGTGDFDREVAKGIDTLNSGLFQMGAPTTELFVRTIDAISRAVIQSGAALCNGGGR